MSASASLELVRALLETRSTILADVDLGSDAGERLLVRSDAGGTMQLDELSGGELVELTALPEPVAGARYVPGSRHAVLEIDAAGNERHQLYLLDLDQATQATVRTFDGLRAITADPRFGHRCAGVSADGRRIAYVSNRGNGVDFDLWLCDLSSDTHRCCYASGAYCQPASGFSPDGRYVSVLRPGDRPLDLDLVLVDAETGETAVPLEHPGEAALVGPPAWIDAGSFYAASNVGRDFAVVVRHVLATQTTTPLAGADGLWDAEVVSSRNGRRILVVENRDGVSRLQLRDAATSAPGPVIAGPETGVVSSHAISHPVLSADGSRVYYTLSTPRFAGDVFGYDAVTGDTGRLTSSPAQVRPDELVSPEAAMVSSFDGEQVPMLVFRPPNGEPRPPVVVVVHGGPESQAMRSFNPVIQALVLTGYGVVVPNVRGSTGYGKRYASLDDTTRRLDAVRDLEAVHGFLDRAGFDPGRAALWGGSYGGYMVLAGLAFQPRLWAAGVDIVGISDLVTFLENTSDYRRAHREREYGSLQDDREFLAAASPLRRADDIRAPLFIIHGRNDPRVPVSEAEQLAANLQRRGVRCTTLIYPDEGHGLARLENRLDAYPQAIRFLGEVLGR
ncbi:MAG TPA: S9 family peptidase [Solirubrobacteraceae bacterium]|jgi:dipeptidyl aminopeptidase/acylaminoacyl peptidase|nr:S9 family peptidase [Solirubrobacteraceae bacterium]